MKARTPKATSAHMFSRSHHYLVVAFFLFGTCAVAQAQQIKVPELVKFVEASLPADAAFVDVDIALWLTISETGVVTRVTLKGDAREPWSSAALAAAQKFIFKPARQDGTAIAVRVPFVYRYRAPGRRGRIIPRRFGRRALHPTPGYHLSGRLLEKGTRSPMAGIAVTARQTGKKTLYETVTDSTGRFVLEGLPTGTLRLEIVTGEHTPIRQTIKSYSPYGVRPKNEPIYLDPRGLSRYRTVVKDRRPPSAADEVSLTDEEITKVPGTFGDPTRVVASLPGVARSPFGLGYYAVRGASFENTGFFIDGHPALYLYHLLAGPGVIAPELIGNLTFYPGGYPVRYGRFAAGAIVLETKDPPNDRWHADIGIDLFKSSVLFSTPFDNKKGMVTVSFRRSYYELLLPAFTDEDVFLRFTDYQLRLTYRFSPTLKAKLLLLGAEDATGRSGESENSGGTSSASFGLGFHRTLVAVDWKLTPELTFTNSAIFEYDHTNTQRISEGDESIVIDIGAFITQLRSYLTWKPARSVEMEAGLDLLYGQVEGNFEVRRCRRWVIHDPRFLTPSFSRPPSTIKSAHWPHMSWQTGPSHPPSGCCRACEAPWITTRVAHTSPLTPSWRCVGNSIPGGPSRRRQVLPISSHQISRHLNLLETHQSLRFDPCNSAQEPNGGRGQDGKFMPKRSTNTWTTWYVQPLSSRPTTLKSAASTGNPT